MAYCLEVHIIDPGDGTIKVTHCFWGLTEREARTYYREHLASCEYFRAAEKEGRTIEELDEVDEDEMPCVEDFEDLEEEDVP
jgi:hypothetical protein